MDIVRQKKIREWALLGLVGAMALIANLPRHLIDRIGLEPGVLMALLGLVVVIGLFLYVRFFFFLLYALLAIGANLPDQWANSLGISTLPMLVALIIMVALSLLNYGAKFLPSGLEPKPRKQNSEATQVLLDAIARDNLPYIKALLTMQFDLDTVDDQGMTPLMRAAQRGNFKVVQMFIKCGASALLSGPSGRASDVALQHNFPAINEFLKKVEEVQSAEVVRRAASEPQAGSAALS